MKPVDASAFEKRGECQQKYKQCLTGLDIPIQEIDELIAIVHSILSYFVDQAFNVQTDQITLQSAGNSFNASLGHATIGQHSETQTFDVPSSGVKGDSNPLGPTEP